MISSNDDEPGEFAVGLLDLLRVIFDTYGATSRTRVENLFRAKEDELAAMAVELFLADLRSTTSLEPRIDIWRRNDQDFETLVVSYDGNYVTQAFFSVRAPEAICELADNL